MERTGILIVSPERDDTNGILSALADDESLLVTAVRTYREALFALGREHVGVILCNGVLPDGNWKDLLGQIAMMNEAPRLVVMAPPDNPALWAEAISLGAHDVLAKPVAPTEIRHVCSSASRSEPRMVAEPVAN
jgi:DNA-binding NtrC family response regulator